MNINSSFSQINNLNTLSTKVTNNLSINFKRNLDSDIVEIQGTQTSAKIYTTNVDELTKAQVKNICSHPVFKDLPVRIMPDTHAGNATVVGFTAPIGQKGEIIPGILGNDIGCGMLCVEIDTNGENIDFEKLDSAVRNAAFLEELAIEDKSIPIELYKEIDEVCAHLNYADTQTQLQRLGTLGGGNHFIELDKSDDGTTYLVIHTGSRNFGKQIADKHEYIARQQNPYDIKKLSYLTGSEAQSYIQDMKTAQKYASYNRKLIANKILEQMGWSSKSSFESVHNYIDKDGIIRKGAISAQKGKQVIIPLNMRDGALIAVGKGNEDWNFSAPHGAGRILSRAKASQNISLKEYQDTMQGIYSTCISQGTIDESPQAYKDSLEIEKYIKPTVEIKTKIKPIYNFKNGH